MIPYRPSNGTEGMWFEEKYCMNCIHCDPDPDGEKQCLVLMNALCFDLKDKEFPKEWVSDADGKNARCTKWVKWDWGNDGNPDDPDNPNYTPPDDPMQLCLPFEMNSIVNDKQLI